MSWLFSALFLVLAGCDSGTPSKAAPSESSRNPVVNDVPTAASPLAHAAMRGDLAEIKRLLEEKAEVNVTDALGRTPLHMAAFYGRTKATELLLSKGAAIDTPDRVGMTPLHAAVLAVNRQEVELLLDHKATVNAKTDMGQT
ncbi:MAG TPA: ankyrin repeat domain-containing protein, partial [Accumulibacter sp.]|nr:ankyrin repeat domain-containing protein [Accumulibacter sp.]